MDPAPAGHRGGDARASTRESPIPLFWTGGWDSTYRLLTLLLVQQRCVQPYYVIDDARRRPSVPAERQAMQRIRQHIEARDPQAAARLLDTIECPLSAIAPDPGLQAHYEACLRQVVIGGQYEWLARFCRQRGIDGMELAIHLDDKARTLLADYVDGSRTALDARFAGLGPYELFRTFRFPLFDQSKTAMRERARQLGFEDLMKLTWFCHRPRGGQPCGTCNPCIYTIEEGLSDRIPPFGRLRYRLRVTPRLRHWLAGSPLLYLGVRTMYRRARALARCTLHSGA